MPNFASYMLVLLNLWKHLSKKLAKRKKLKFKRLMKPKTKLSLRCINS